MKLALDIEQTDKYEKAKMELVQALNYFFELTEQEQRMLAEELVGVTNVVALQNIVRQAFGQ